MIAPLSLCNVLTVIMAVTCLSTMAALSRGEVVKMWRLAVPASLAVVQALVLLAGVFEATFTHDAEWLIAGLIGSMLGRARGWAMPVAVDRTHGLVQPPRSVDGKLAAGALVILALVDFAGAAFEDPVLPCDVTAAAAAFFAGYIACRSAAIGMRAGRAPHAELTSHGVAGERFSG